MAAIDPVALTTSYGTLKAFDGVSLSVWEGEFVGILGPWRWQDHHAGNRRGLRQPDAGSATILGERSWPRNPALLPRMGGQPQASSFFEWLTAREQIHTFDRLCARPRPPRWSFSTSQSAYELAEFGMIRVIDTMPNRRRGKIRQSTTADRAAADEQHRSLAPEPYT